MDQLVEVVTTPRPLSLYTLFSQNGRKYQSDVSLKTLIIDAFVVTISGTVACWYNPPPTSLPCRSTAYQYSKKAQLSLTSVARFLSIQTGRVLFVNCNPYLVRVLAYLHTAYQMINAYLYNYFDIRSEAIRCQNLRLPNVKRHKTPQRFRTQYKFASTLKSEALDNTGIPNNSAMTVSTYARI